MQKLVSKALTNLMAHFTFLTFKNLTLWLYHVELLCLQVVSWKLAKPCCHGGKLSTLHFLFELISLSFVYGYSRCEKSWESCGIMEFLYVLKKCLGR
jgi:hypothetical protein